MSESEGDESEDVQGESDGLAWKTPGGGGVTFVFSSCSALGDVFFFFFLVVVLPDAFLFFLLTVDAFFFLGAVLVDNAFLFFPALPFFVDGP